MTKQSIILLHLVLWLLLIVPVSCASVFMFKMQPDLVLSIYPSATLDYVIMDAIFNLITFGVAFYSFYFFIFEWLFRQTLSWKGLAQSMTLVFGLFVLEQVVILFVYPDEVINDRTIVYAHLTMFVWLLFRLGLAVGARALVEFLDERKTRKKLEAYNLKSEMSLFRAQVNPHFLFNTLNNIDALIYSNPDMASEMLIKLSKQMRYMLYDSNVEEIDLASELEFIRNYIDLESIRLTNKNFVQLEVEGNVSNWTIAPMLFIAFVENAFKHCSNTKDDGGLMIKVVVKDSEISFNCLNHYDNMLPKKKVKYSGVGLDLVKKRLKLIYPQKHQLNIDTDHQLFNINLSINK